ncbi:MAG: DUF177 domain-containing protein [Simkaniaceae bacterium]|jgi:uncharacterized metal-binding protein YceD (DUF177 family)
METQLKIYIDRLSDEKTEKIRENLTPDFIDVDEEDLQFRAPVHIEGQAYIAESHLIVQLKIETEALIPCSICNQKVTVPLKINPLYHTEELSNIRGQIYDYTPPLREGILLEVPTYVECGENCPEREKIKNYLSEGNQQFPFADLKEN